MNLLDIARKLEIPVLSSGKAEEKEFYGVDYYRAGEEHGENIVYLSQERVDEQGLSLVYGEGVDSSSSPSSLSTSLPLEECFRRFHRYFLRQDRKLLLVKPFVSLFLSASDHDMKKIARKAAEILDNPIIITDAAYKVLAIDDAGAEVDDPIFEEGLRTGYCSSSSIALFEKERVTEKVLTSQEPFILSTGLARKVHRILGKVMIHGKVVAYLGVLESKRPFDQESLGNASLLCQILRHVFESDSSLLGGTNIIHESIIQEVMRGEIGSPLVLSERLKSARWKMRTHFRVTVVPTFNEHRSIDNIPYFIARISEKLRLKVVRYENNLLVVNNYDDPKEWHRQVAFIEKEARTLNLKVGISNEFSSLLDLRHYYEEALKAVSIALMIQAKDTTFYFAAFLPYYLISCVDKKTLRECRNVYYERLRRHDEKHRTEYVDTLYYYILFNCNANRAAERLSIHRNTLAHRLEKIVEISNINLQNGIILQNFVLFAQIQHYLEKAQDGARGMGAAGDSKTIL